MLEDLVTLPLRLTVRAGNLALRSTERIAGGALRVAGRVVPLGGSDQSEDGGGQDSERPDRSAEAPAAGPSERSAANETATAPGAEATPESAAQEAAPSTAAPAGDAATAPAAEPSPPEPAHVSTEPELVEEFAEPGAEDGAGAAIHVDEPWKGYAGLSAEDVIDRLSLSTPAELGAVALYEAANRNREAVIDAAQRQLALIEREQ